MRTIALVQLDKRRPAVVLTASSKLQLLTRVTVAPITSVIRGVSTEVSVGPRNGLDQASVISCDNIMTIPIAAIGRSIGLLFDDEEPALAAAISSAFELHID